MVCRNNRKKSPNRASGNEPNSVLGIERVHLQPPPGTASGRRKLRMPWKTLLFCGLALLSRLRTVLRRWRTRWVYLLLTGVALIFLLCWILALNGPVWLPDHADALTLLESYRQWYGLIQLSVTGWTAAIAIGTMIFVYQTRRQLPFGRFIVLTAALMITGLLWMALLLDHIPDLRQQALMDIEQIKAGTLEEAEVFFSPKVRPGTLPGPTSDFQREPVQVYGGVGEDTNNQWVRYRIPDGLDFTLDSTALFDENRSIQWNLENADRYRIRYTTQFLVVTEIEVIPPQYDG